MERIEFPRSLKSNMRLIITESVLSGIYIVITGAMFGSIFLTAFARKIGMSTFHIGLLAASTQFARTLQFFACYIMENHIQRKKFFLLNAYAARILGSVAVFIPAIIGKHLPGLTIWAFFIIVTISNIMNFFAVTAWLTWMKDIIPNKFRATFFSKKNFYTSIGTLAIPFIVGKFLDKYDTVFFYAIVFTFFILISKIGVFSMSKIKDKENFIQEKMQFIDFFKLPFENKNFKYYLLFSIFLTFATIGIAPFFQLHLLEGLEFKKATIGLLILILGVGSIITYLLWGKFSKKYGHRNSLELAMRGLIVLPFLSALSNKSNGLILMIIVYFLAGIVWSGINLSSINLLLTISPQKRNSVYVASFSFMNGIVGFLSPLVGVLIIKIFEPYMVYPVRALFITCGIFRIIALFFLTRVKELNTIPIRFRYFFKPRY